MTSDLMPRQVWKLETDRLLKLFELKTAPALIQECTTVAT